MTSGPVRCNVADGIARLTLDRPDAGNAIDLEVAAALDAATLALAGDPSVRVVLLTGTGRTFCVGGDLRSFSGHTDELGAHLLAVTSHLHPAIERLAHLDAPVVAAVQGSAAGAGMSLAAGADLVLCAESAKLVLAYSRLGLSSDGGGSWYLPRLIGMKRALELAFTNRALTAVEAVEWGIATRVVPDDRLEEEAELLVGELAAMAPGALAGAKRLMRGSLATTLADQLALEASTLAANADRHGAEGIAAFLEKRPPKF